MSNESVPIGQKNYEPDVTVKINNKPLCIIELTNQFGWKRDSPWADIKRKFKAYVTHVGKNNIFAVGLTVANSKKEWIENPEKLKKKCPLNTRNVFLLSREHPADFENLREKTLERYIIDPVELLFEKIYGIAKRRE